MISQSSKESTHIKYLFIMIAAGLTGCISTHLGCPFTQSSFGIGYEVHLDVG